MKRRRVFATLKVLGTVLEQLSEEIPDEVGFFTLIGIHVTVHSFLS